VQNILYQEVFIGREATGSLEYQQK